MPIVDLTIAEGTLSAKDRDRLVDTEIDFPLVKIGETQVA